jgi:hypothetical protein
LLLLKRTAANIIIPCVICFLISSEAGAQYFKLKGTVYDSTKNYPLLAVSVLSTSGKGTTTDAAGRYEIEVTETDSVWFSYLNKPTIKYAVGKIYDARQFDIALHVNIPVLKEVIVRRRNYKLDSLQNRIDYAKGFNWERPKLKANVGSGPGASVGFDLEEIIRMFQFRKNRSNEAFRERLLQQERDKFIDYRFNKGLVLRLTGLNGEERDSFMLRCRPTYEFCLAASDYDFQSWIKKCFEMYKTQKAGTKFKKPEL